jgi:hypothetical protein
MSSQLAKTEKLELTVSEVQDLGVIVSRRLTTGFMISRSPIPRSVREQSHEVSLWVQISRKGNRRSIAKLFGPM